MLSTTIPLDRKTIIFLYSLRNVTMSRESGFALDDGGLGLFDAFIASLSMIVVSEVYLVVVASCLTNL